MLGFHPERGRQGLGVPAQGVISTDSEIDGGPRDPSQVQDTGYTWVRLGSQSLFWDRSDQPGPPCPGLSLAQTLPNPAPDSLTPSLTPPRPRPALRSCSFSSPAETRGAAATRPLALEGPVQSHHGAPALTHGPRRPRDGAKLGACTRPAAVGGLGGRTLPPPDAPARAGDFSCTM